MMFLAFACYPVHIDVGRVNEGRNMPSIDISDYVVDGRRFFDRKFRFVSGCITLYLVTHTMLAWVFAMDQKRDAPIIVIDNFMRTIVFAKITHCYILACCLVNILLASLRIPPRGGAFPEKETQKNSANESDKIKKATHPNHCAAFHNLSFSSLVMSIRVSP